VTGPRIRPGRRRSVVTAVAAVLVGLVVLAGCGGAPGALLDSDVALANAGFHSAEVGFSSSTRLGSTTVDGVTVSASLGAVPTSGDLRQVSEIIWQKVHFRFAVVAITLHGGGQTVKATYAFDQLQRDLGPRNPAWNRTTLTHSVLTVGLVVLAVLAGVVVLAVLLTVVLVTRRRRRRGPPVPPFGGPGYLGGPGTPAGPWAPGPYGAGPPGYGPWGSGPPGGYDDPGAGGPPAPGYPPPGYPPSPGYGTPPPPPGYDPPPGYPPPPANPGRRRSRLSE
jgi:hypothetical protein